MTFFNQQLRSLGKDDYNGIINVYQQYIDLIWNELFEAVQSFKSFSEFIVNGEISKKGRK